MATVAEHLVGRAAELGSLDRVLDGLGRDAPATILLLGEPGIGKTRLLAELAAHADARGCIALAGSASELEADLPFWILVDALEEYVAGLDPRRLATLDDDVRAELAQLFPALSGFGGARGSEGPDERYRVHRAVRELLERVAATAPLVLALDDVHWADAASVDLLAALLRRPPAAAVLIAMAARPRQLPDRLAGALERAHRAGGLTRLELGALAREEAAELLGDAVDGPLADALYGESGGNPFYLQQLARSVRRTGEPVPVDAVSTLAGVEVPPAVAASVTGELALLSAATRRVLEGATVAGDPFEPELAAAAAGVDETAAAQALDDLLTEGMVRPTDVPRRFRFRHPLIRRAVYDATPGGWLLGAHERCAALLAERGASPAARAHHVEHAARHGDAEALALLTEAGAAAAARAPASAARWFGAALRLLPETAPAEQRVALLTARAGALAVTGELAAGRADLLESIDLLPEDAAATRTKLTAACAGIEHLLGDHQSASDRLADALERLPDPATPEAVELMLELAIGSLFDTEYPAMCLWARRALDGARPLDDRPLAATAAGLLAIAEACSGAIEEAQAHRAEAREIVDGLPDDLLTTRLTAAGFLATAELYLDRYGEAVAHAGRGLELARATGQMSPTLMPTLATAWCMTGRFPEASQLLDAALDVARASTIPQALAWMLVNRSQAEMAAGEMDAALACAEESFALTRQFDQRFMSAWAGLALAMALLPAGDPARAAAELLDRAGGEKLTALPAGWRALGFEVLARCRLVLGERDAARRSVALAELTAAATGLPMAAAWAQRAAAAVALDAGDPATAAERALASAAAADRAGCGRGRVLAHPRGPGAGAGRRARQGGRRAGARGDGARRLRRAAAARRRRARAAQAGARRAPAQPQGGRRRHGRGDAHGTASCRSPRSSSTAAPTPRSRRSCSSASRPSRPTCATSSASSACRRASNSRARSSARAAHPEIRVRASAPARRASAGLAPSRAAARRVVSSLM